MSSDSRVLVVRIANQRKHDNADTLSVVDVFGGYPCIVRIGDFADGDLAAYIPVDMLVPDAPHFAHLRQSSKLKPGDPVRIKAKRLRGVFSMGLLVKAPEGAIEGDDVTDALGVTKWEPEELPSRGPSRPGGKFLPGDAENDPGFLPAYTDIENLRKYKHLLVGEEVVVTEKIHGACSSFVYHAHRDAEPRLWIRSRRQFKKPEGGGIWADVAKLYHFDEVLRDVCPGIAISGEVYGQVQDLQYGIGGVDLVAFDAFSLATMRYLDHDDFIRTIALINMRISTMSEMRLRAVPILYRGSFDYDKIAVMAEGVTILGDGKHVREGVVVRPTKERWDSRLGRVILKLAGEGYLTR